MRALYVRVLLLAAAPAARAADPAALDPGFGRDGLVRSSGSVIVTGPDDTTIEAGDALEITRRDRDGKVVGDVPGLAPGFGATAMATTPAGGLVIAGERFAAGAGTPTAGVLVRVLADESPDPSFGDGGRVELTGGEAPGAVAVEPDGSVVLGNYRGLHYRTAHGAPDPARPGDLTAPSATVTQLQTDTAGRLTVTYTDYDFPPEVGVVRVLADGTRDPTFRGAESDGLVSAMTLPGGLILPTSLRGIGVARFGVDGQPLSTSVIPTDETGATAASVDANGAAVVAGSSFAGGALVVGRFGADGAPDTRFGQCGVTNPAVGLPLTPDYVTVQQSGRIVVSGIVDGGDRYFVALRGGAGATPPVRRRPQAGATEAPDGTTYGSFARLDVRVDVPARATVTVQLRTTSSPRRVLATTTRAVGRCAAPIALRVPKARQVAADHAVELVTRIHLRGRRAVVRRQRMRVGPRGWLVESATRR